MTPLEKLLYEIENVDYIYSISQPSGGLIIVRFLVGTDPDQAAVRVHTKIAAAMDTMPEGMMPPVVKPRTIDDVPVAAYTLWSEQASTTELRRVADEIKVELTRHPRVAQVWVLGGQRQAVRVDFDRERLASSNVSILQAHQALTGVNWRLPAGTASTLNREIQVDVGQFLTDAADIADVVVAVYNGYPVYLKDVARVEAGPEEPAAYVWMGTGPAAPEKGLGRAGLDVPAVTLAVAKKPGTNAVDLVRDLDAQLGRLRGTLVPSDIQVTKTRDYGFTANEKSTELIDHMLIATLAVVILMGFALGRREAVVVAVAVPVTLALTIAASLLLRVHPEPGDPVRPDLLHRHPGGRRHRGGREHRTATTSSVGPPAPGHDLRRRRGRQPDHPRHLYRDRRAAASCLRERPDGAVHAPDPDQRLGRDALLAAGGVHHLPLVDLPPVPKEGRSGAEPPRRRARPGDAGGGEAGGRMYARVMPPLIRSRALRWGSLLAVVVLLGLSMVTLFVRFALVKMLPFDNKSRAAGRHRRARGLYPRADQRGGRGHRRDLQRTCRRSPTTRSTSAPPRPSTSTAWSATTSCVREATWPTSRSTWSTSTCATPTSHDFAKEVRALVAPLGARLGVNVKVTEVPPGPPVISTLVAEVYGPTLEGRLEVAEKVKGVFEATDGVVDVDWMVEEPGPRYEVRIDREKAIRSGINPEQVVRTLRVALSGAEAGRAHVATARDPVPILLRLDRAQRSHIEDLLQLTVHAREGRMVPLAEIATRRSRDPRAVPLPQEPAAGDLRAGRGGWRRRGAGLRHPQHGPAA